MFEKEMVRFFSLSVLPILVLGIGYLILKMERKKRILQEKNKGQK